MVSGNPTKASFVSNQSSNPQPTTGAASAVVATSATRRRLLRGGFAAPVLMTVAARPVMAAECVTSSAHTSLTGSRQIARQSCSGGTPTYWIKQQRGSSGYLMEAGGGSGNDKRTFGNIFANGGVYANLTLLEVLKKGEMPAGTDDSVAAHLVAAVLNAERAMTPSTVLSSSKAKDIWFDYSPDRTFVPTAGVTWSSMQIVDWLRTTMPLNA
jgi:hypothetical protein